MISAEKSHTLQNTVPSIMHTSRLEKPIFTPPTSNSIIERATVKMTNVMDRDKRLLFDLKYFSAAEKMLPITKPIRMESTNFQQRLNEDARHIVITVVDRFRHAEADREYNQTDRVVERNDRQQQIRQFALRLVLADNHQRRRRAVAVAIAPRTIASAMDIESPSTKKCSPMSTRSTISVAVSA